MEFKNQTKLHQVFVSRPTHQHSHRGAIFWGGMCILNKHKGNTAKCSSGSFVRNYVNFEVSNVAFRGS